MTPTARRPSRRATTAPKGAASSSAPTPEAPIIRFASEVVGLDLWPWQRRVLTELYADNIRVGIMRCGRRSGKGTLAALVGVFEATVNAGAHLAAAPAGEPVWIIIVSASQKSARIVHGYVRRLLRAPALRALVVEESADEISLSNGVNIATRPCYAPAIRGVGAPIAILDELAWYQGRDGSPLDPAAIWDAIVPAGAQFPERRTIVCSTPRWSIGFFADLCREADTTPGWRTWHIATAEANPTIPLDFLESERLRDPASYAREYGAEWDSGIGSVFPQDAILAAIRHGAPELPPEPGTRYVVSVDAGFVGDKFAVVTAHSAGEQVVVDLVRSWAGTRKQPVQLDSTLDEISAIARRYNGAHVLCDQYSSQAILQGLAKRGADALERPWDNAGKVDAAGSVRRVLLSGLLSLPDHSGLIGELSTLEQRPMATGRVRIAAPPGGSDDFATAAMMAVHELAEPATPGWVTFMQAQAAAPPPEPRSVLPDGSPLPVCGLRFRKPDGSIAVCAAPQMHPAGGHAEAVEQAAPECPDVGTVLPDGAPCAELYRTEKGGIDACALPKGHAERRHGLGEQRIAPPDTYPSLSAAALFGGR
jgi:hypothetical protein